ncbi:hypothetical protein BVC80_9083g86 [Macleaya cordata]|uniref:Uncharacterized protein n=1 Tax=Macleaya cordata TaxID=56857 RepID=A0A200PRJ0_MACCD|nr:hypothetical protein BVC80_9083g86 [Macleaya cordata]
MPGNEVADKVHNFFEQDNLSQGQHQSQVPSGNWPLLNSNPLVGNQRQGGTQISSNLKNYGVPQSDSERGNGWESPRMPLGTNLTQLTSRAEFAKSQSRNQQLTLNGFTREHQGFQTRQNQAEFEFLGDDAVSDRHNLTPGSLSILESQQGNATEHRSVMARSSGRLETAEAPINFDFLGGQPQLTRGQQLGVPQPQPRQQAGFNDMPPWQHNLMLKQLQLQRQRQLQLLEQSARHQNPMNQSSAMVKQAAGEQLLSVFNGMPIHDGSNFFWPSELMGGDPKVLSTSQMPMVGNMRSPAVQGSGNGPVFSHEQGQVSRSMGLVHQQFDQSLFGAPVTNTRGALNQYPNQGISHDCNDMLHKASGNQVPKPMMQSSAFNNSFHGNQSAVIQDEEVHGRQEPGGWSGNLQEKGVPQVGPSHSSVSLDPTEKKILFDTDENIWEAPLGGSGNMGAGGFGNSLEVGGSWTALMQYCVAEPSSSDTGLQDEWSDLSYQQTERSTGNQQPVTFRDAGKERANWVDNSMQCASSLTSRPFPLFDDANMGSSGCSIGGFQQPGVKLSFQHGEIVQNNVSHESIQGTPKGAGPWLDQSVQQNSLVEGIRQVRPPMIAENASEGAWDGQIYEQSESSAHSAETELNAQKMQGSWVHQKSTSSYNIGVAPSNKQNGWNITDSSQSGDAPSKIRENLSAIQLSQRSDKKRGVHTEKDHDVGMWKIAAVPNSSIARNNQEMDQQTINRHHIDYGQHSVDSLAKYNGGENVGNYQNQLDKGPQILESSLNNPDRVTGENCEGKQLNFYQKESSNDSQKSNQSHHTITGGGQKKNLWSSASDSHALTSGNQMFEGQVGRPTFGSRDFQHHPMGNLEVNVDPNDTKRQVTHSEALSQQVARGSQGHEHGYFGQSKFVGHVRDNTVDMGKGHSSNFQGNPKGPMEISSRGIRPGYGSSISGSFDGKTGLFGPSQKAFQASQNMLELIHKVDQSREQSTVKHFGSSDISPSSEMPESEASDASIAQLQGNQLSSSQGFGLRLGPPSQRLPVSNHAFSPQNSSQTVNDLNSRYVDSDVREKGRVLSTSSMQTSRLSHDMSQGGNKDNKFCISGQSGNETSNMHEKSSGAFTSGLQFPRNELQPQHMSSASGHVMTNHSFDRLTSRFRQPHDSHDGSLADQSAQASLHGANSRIPPMSHDPGQERAVLEAVPASQPSVMPGMSQQGAFPVLHNVWNNVVPNQQHVASGRAHKVPFQSIHSSNNNPATTSLATPKPDGQDIKKGGIGPSDYGTCSVNSQHSFGEERLENESPWQQTPPEKADLAPQTSGASQGTQAVTARSRQLEVDRGRYGNDPALAQTGHVSLQTSAACNRDIEAFGRSLRQSQGLHQTYSLLHQVQAMKGVETDPTKNDAKRFKGADCGQDVQRIAAKAGQQLFYGYKTVARDTVDNELKTAGRPISFPSDNSKTVTFSSEAREDQNTVASSKPGLGDIPSQDRVAFGHKSYQIHSGQPSLTPVGSQINPQMAPSWFEQYGALKNGQMPLMPYAQGTMQNVAQQLIFGKASEILHGNTSTKQVHADTTQVGGESTSTTLVGSELVSHSLPPDYADQSLAIVEPKKRKSATLELLPWHKEVAHGSQRLQTISMAEQDWAQAANRLIEKLEDETEMSEDGQLLFRSRRRLIMTAQLMQQLLRPPPPAILSSDATSNYESVTYTVAKLALGDACSLLSYSGNDSRVAPEKGNTTSTRIKTAKRPCDLYFSEVVENFITRAKKLENDLLRLDKRASILDIRLESQDLEKFSVINRFAKFHGRGNADVADTGSNTQKTCPQRYVTAFAMPRNVPEGVQCLSL